MSGVNTTFRSREKAASECILTWFHPGHMGHKLPMILHQLSYNSQILHGTWSHSDIRILQWPSVHLHIAHTFENLYLALGEIRILVGIDYGTIYNFYGWICWVCWCRCKRTRFVAIGGGIVVFIEPEPGPTVEVESCSGTTVEASVGAVEVATGLEVGAGVSGQGTGSQVVHGFSWCDVKASCNCC